MSVMPKPDYGSSVTDAAWCSQRDCAGAAVPGSPVPLCPTHLRQVYEFAEDVVRERWTEAVAEASSIAAYELAAKPPVTVPSWVYFIRKGDLIKIGYSTEPAIRFRTLRPDEVLAVIPGSMRDEQRCHAAFAHLREHHEYFRPGPDLLAFIDGVKGPQAA